MAKPLRKLTADQRRKLRVIPRMAREVIAALESNSTEDAQRIAVSAMHIARRAFGLPPCRPAVQLQLL